MHVVEYIKNIRRKCLCVEHTLVWYKKEYKKRIPAKGQWVNDFVQLLTHTDKYKTEHGYIAECGTCGQFYFATETKKAMIDSLKYIGDFYREKDV